MRLFLFLMLIFFPFAAAGQKLNGPSALVAGESSGFYHEEDDQYRYLVYELEVPAGSIGFIGLRRLSGTGDHNMRVGTSIAADTFDRAQVDGVLSSNTQDDALPSLMVFATDSLAAETLYAEFWAANNDPGVWKVGYETFNIGAELFAAGTAAAIETIVVCSLTDCNAERDVFTENLDRAIDLGMSIISRDNVCAVATDVIVREIMAAFEKEIGGSRFVVAMARNLFKSLAATAADAQC